MLALVGATIVAVSEPGDDDEVLDLLVDWLRSDPAGLDPFYTDDLAARGADAIDRLRTKCGRTSSTT